MVKYIPYTSPPERSKGIIKEITDTGLLIVHIPFEDQEYQYTTSKYTHLLYRQPKVGEEVIIVLVKNYKVDTSEDLRVMPANSAAAEELDYKEAYYKYT